jgi:hypothetical protein
VFSFSVQGFLFLFLFFLLGVLQLGKNMHSLLPSPYVPPLPGASNTQSSYIHKIKLYTHKLQSLPPPQFPF